jgi:hypothetical protein
MMDFALGFFFGCLTVGWLATKHAQSDRAGLRVQIVALQAALARLKKGVGE